MPNPYQASFLPPHEVAELHDLMAEEMKSHTASEAIGSHLSLFYRHKDAAWGWPQHNLDEARKKGFYREETWRKCKDGWLFWAWITLTALHDPTGKLVGYSKITLDLADHKMREQCVKER